jgi:hypothetical protein
MAKKVMDKKKYYTTEADLEEMYVDPAGVLWFKLKKYYRKFNIVGLTEFQGKIRFVVE